MDRHRAAGDALATVKLFELIRDNQNGDNGLDLISEPIRQV